MSSSSKRSRSAQDESWSSESIDTSDGGSDGEKRKKVTEKKEKKRPRSVEIESSSSSSSSSSSTSTDEDVDEKIPPVRSRTPDLHSTPPRLVLRNPALGAAREPPPAPEKRPRQTEERHRPVPFISDEHPLSIYEAQPEGGGSGPAVTRVRTLRRRVDRRGKSSYSPVKIPLRLSKDVVEIDVVIRATRDYWEKLEAKTKGIIPVRDRLLGVVENKIAQVAGEPDAKRRRLSASLLLDLPERRSAQKFARPILQNKGIAAAASIFDGSDGSKPADAKRMVAIAEVFATCIFPAIFYFNEDRRSERFALVSKDLERRSDEDLSMLAVAEAVVPLRRLVFGYLARRAGWKYVFDRSFELCYAGMMTVCEQRMPPDLAKISVSENALTRKVLAKALAEERIAAADWMQRHWRGPISSERAGPYPIEFSLLLPCCKTGSRPGVQWLLRHDLLHRDTAVDTQCKALVVACRCGHPGFVQYMFETFYPSAARLTASNCEIVCAALESGNREVVEYVFDANGLTFGDLATDCRWAKECAFIAACAGANLKLAEWLCRRVFIDAETLRRCSTSVLVRACGEGRVDVLAWLRDKFKMTKKTVRDTFSDAYAYNAAFLKACKNNQLGAVRWLVRELNFNKNDVERYSFLALRNACTCGGGLETARFLAGEFGLAGELQKSNFDRDRRTLVKEARHSAKSDFEGTPLYSFMRDELRIANEELRSHILY